MRVENVSLKPQVFKDTEFSLQCLGDPGGADCDIDKALVWVETPLQKQICLVFRMPDSPMPAAESGKNPAAEPSSTDCADVSSTSASIQSDLAALAARFAAHGGGSFSAEFAADLAFDIVLNEIVEQASLVTGATGAAIFLVRDGEMVCRACGGSTAPQLGSRLESGMGVAKECLRTCRLQRCDDVQADPRPAMEAARSLGVRSVLALPLLRNQQVAGLVEVFSTRAAAFGEREERTLETLGERVLQNMESVAVPPSVSPEAPIPLPSFAQANIEVDRRPLDPRIVEGARKIVSGRSFDVLTGALGVAVLICALMLGLLARQRLRSQRISAHEHSGKATSAIPGATGEVRAASEAANAFGAGASSVSPSNSRNQAGRDATPRPGELMVYENGREVFHMPSARGTAASQHPPEGLVQSAASVEPESTMELSAAAAEGGLVHRVEPDYPEEARRQRVQGAVVLEVHINPDGAVQELKLISGSPLLAQAATDAVRQWKFKPHTVNGHRAEMQTVVTLNFRLPL
jgi:TonB family protein